MVDSLKEYLNENPDLQKYIVDGKINWSSMGIDLEYEQLKDFLISNKVYLRDVADYGLPHHLRLSIGSKENNIIAFDKIAGFLRK